jgi:hypothetical protein
MTFDRPKRTRQYSATPFHEQTDRWWL